MYQRNKTKAEAHIGEMRIMNCGHILTITDVVEECSKGGNVLYIGTWEDGAKSRSFLYNHFKNGKIAYTNAESHIGESKLMNCNHVLTITEIAKERNKHRAILYIGTWEDDTKSRPFVYRDFKNGKIAYTNAKSHIGESKKMNCGQILTIVDVAKDRDKGGDILYIGIWEDNTKSKPFRYYTFKIGKILNPNCITGISYGERLIRDILIDRNVDFIYNTTLESLFTDVLHLKKKHFNEYVNQLHAEIIANGGKCTKTYIKRCRFDFAVLTDDNGIYGFIEYDGEQHFKFIEYFYKTISNFLYRCDCDAAKTMLASNANIPLLRIAYFMKDDPKYDIESMVDHFLDPANHDFYLTQNNPVLTNEEYWSLLESEKEKLLNENVAAISMA